MKISEFVTEYIIVKKGVNPDFPNGFRGKIP